MRDEPSNDGQKPTGAEGHGPQEESAGQDAHAGAYSAEPRVPGSSREKEEAQPQQAPSNAPPIEGDDARDDIRDCSGKEYTVQDVLRLILAFKKDSRSFFWGDCQNRCNKKNRCVDDGWYPWSKEMLTNCTKNEAIMRDLLVTHGHAKIQALCRNSGGGIWNKRINEKLEQWMVGIKEIQETLKSPGGMLSCWGRFKYDGILKYRMMGRRQEIQRTQGPKRVFDLVDYIEHVDRVWAEHFDDVREKLKLTYDLYNRL